MSRDSNHPHDALFLAEISHIPDIATAHPYLEGIPCSSTQPVRSLLLRDCTLCSWIVLDDAIFGYNPHCGWATTFLGKPNNSVYIYIYIPIGTVLYHYVCAIVVCLYSYIHLYVLKKCMYVCMCVCMCVCVCVCMYVCMYVCVYMCIYVSICICAYM